MNDDRVLRELQRVAISEYLLACREHGRQDIPPVMRKEASDLYRLTSDLRLTTSKLSMEVRQALELANDFLYSEHYISQHQIPRYTSYTNLRVLDRFLGVGAQISLQATLQNCGVALALLVRDWRDYEIAAMMDYPERYARTNFQKDEVRERIRGLEELAKLTTKKTLPDVHSLDVIPTHTYRSDWIYYACEADGAIGLCHLTGIPQSQWHDEYMFLRTIHLSEIAFHGINEASRAAIQLSHEGQIATSEACMSQANYLASFLVKLFAIFDTMPVTSFFDGFRAATGNASAIQSQKYQLMDKLTRGINDLKKASLKKQPEGYAIADWNLPENWGLSGLATSIRTSETTEQASLLSQIEELDRLLHMWRSKHLGIARKYLPPDAKGTGDEGVPYLEANVRDPMIRTNAANAVPSEGGRLRITAAAQISAKDTQFHWCEVTRLSGAALVEAMRSEHAATHKYMLQKQEDVARSIQIYHQFFADHQRTCPLTGQFSKILSGGITTPNAVAETLLSIEFSTGTLIGIFDMRKVSGALRLDVAVDGESYESISGKQMRCRSGDWVLRDGKSIIASYFDGPDKRTALDQTRLSEGTGSIDVAVMIFGAPQLPQAVYDSAKECVAQRILNHAEESHWFSWTC